ncbi:hypothetical protein OPV22_032285 [Ensete ventricosum]|uniref:RING-type domain-containing protein n=1 Tax=Ensete ventricosum TaxID=4639 RepID=A0AAV8PYU5_ENSVE|nr:hypothetical protein OPV22_032285 [Ensete ventricosum]
MAVRAKQPSVVRNQNRGEQQRTVDPPPVPPPVLARNQTASQTPRKRIRKEPAAAATTAAAAQVTATATSNNAGYGYSSAPMLMSSPLQLPPGPPSLSTGFKLFGEQKQHQVFNHFSPLPPSSSQDFEDIAAIVKKYEGEVQGLLRSQADQFRRTLLDKWRRHCQILLCAAEVEAARRIGEKEAEAEQALRRCAQLQQQLTHVKVESIAWQAKALEAQHNANILRAQLEQATATPPERTGESAGEDGGLAMIEDAQSSNVSSCTGSHGSCRVCLWRSITVAVLPCGHLCLCADCAASGAVPACPSCGQLSSGIFHVVFC